jgi:hypothetical protein
MDKEINYTITISYTDRHGREATHKSEYTTVARHLINTHLFEIANHGLAIHQDNGKGWMLLPSQIKHIRYEIR